MKAVILAAGNGTRMNDLTINCPKPLLPYQDHPFIWHICDRMTRSGIDEFLIVINPIFKSQFTEALKDFKVQFIDQKFPLGTAHALSLCGQPLHSFKFYPFLFTYGDILFSIADYTYFVEQAKNEYTTYVAVNQVDDPCHGGAVYFDQDMQISKIIEKPVKGTSKTHWNASGLFLLSTSIFQELLEKTPTVYACQREWVFTEMLHCRHYMQAVPIQEWIHLEDEQAYRKLITES